MECLERYIDYLKLLKKNNTKNKLFKSDLEHIKDDAIQLLHKINDNFSEVEDDDLRRVFAFSNELGVENIFFEYKTIKIFSKYFNDQSFINQPQVIIAKRNFEKLKDIINKYILGLNDQIERVAVYDDDTIDRQIELTWKINKRDMLTYDELQDFYNNLMFFSDNINVNKIIINVAGIMTDLLNKELNIEQEKTIKKEAADYSKDFFSEEELDKINDYVEVIKKIIALDDGYVFDNFYSFKLFYEQGDKLQLNYYQDKIRKLLGIELNEKVVNLLDRFYDIYNLEADINDLTNEYLIEMRKTLNGLDNLFLVSDNDMVDEVDGRILEHPKALVVFLENTHLNQTYVETDYGNVKKINRDVAKIAVKKIVENLYANNVSPSERGHIIGDLKIEHANAGRYARCFYTKISVSSIVSELLKEKYGTGMVYLYIGFTNLGNHEVNYGGELLNRVSREYEQIKYLNNLFGKEVLTNSDKREIEAYIDGALMVTRKLNSSEGMKK